MRIAVIGRPGAGKSTFSSRLAAATGLPLHHIDKQFFTHNWRDNPQFPEWLAHTVATEQWIIDGIASRSFESRFQRADIVIHFKLPYWRCLWRIIKRRFCGTPFNDRAPGCQDTLSWKLTWYLLTIERTFAERLYPLVSTYPNTRYMEVTSDTQAQELLDSLVAETKQEKHRNSLT